MAKSSNSSGPSKPKPSTPAIPHPSASVILVSPQNQILLLHRVKTSSSFASAHVFPGGNLDPFHDGDIPDVNDSKRHVDGDCYRIGAIRETFEESGLLLAKDQSGSLLRVDEASVSKGREAIHSNKTKFLDWLAERKGEPDSSSLIPFTRWITPGMQPKRFTTQMYIYFLPLSTPSSSSFTLPAPTHDGGKEHTAAEFAHAAEWLARYKRDEVIFFPPQFVLLSLIADYLKPLDGSADQNDLLEKQRSDLIDFVKTGRWSEKCIHVRPLRPVPGTKRMIMDLSWPGSEVEGQNRFGEHDLVFTSALSKQGPRELELAWRKDFEDQKAKI